MHVASLLDYGDLEGGLARMMDRYKESGTMTGEPNEDAFVATHPAALLLGLLFDQRVRAEYAFTGPKRLFDRLGHLDMHLLAEMDLETLQAHFAAAPAVHRFTNKMAEMTRDLAKTLVEHYNGESERLWNDGIDAAELAKRARALPGFGADKSKKFKFALHYFGYRDFSDPA